MNKFKDWKCPKKLISTSKSLENKFGGKWKYINFQWECDDGNRYVCNVLTGVDMNGEYTGQTSLCMYFRDGQTPKWV